MRTEISSGRRNVHRPTFLIFAALCVVVLTSCSDPRDRLPEELAITEELYREATDHFVGPSGINHSLTIYRLSPETSDMIRSRGLDFLNHLPSAKTYETDAFRAQFYSTEERWRPFEYWDRTPIPKDERWIRQSYSVAPGDQPTLGEYVGDAEQDGDFMKAIDGHAESLLHEIIRSPGGYYAYGGYSDKGVLILSPEHERAIYLFRG